MKVLQLIKTTRGATWALRQVRELVKLGHDIHVALPDEDGHAQAYRDVGASVHVLPVDVAHDRNPLNMVRRALGLRRLVKRLRPDIVHSHFLGITLTMRLGLRGIDVPRLFQVPGILHLERGLTRIGEKVIATKRDYWAASCALTRRIYEGQGIAPERVGLAYYPTDFAGVEPRKGTGALHEELGLDSDTRLIGMVAYAYAPKKWLGYERGIKGHEDLIDAIAILRERGHKVHGVFVGGAWVGAEQYFEDIKAYGAAKLGAHGSFLGTRHDVADLYPDIAVAVHPSHSENLGGAVESLALGRPTVATDIGGFADVVVPGVTGWLARAKDPADLADKIEQALGDPRAEEMALAGRNLVIEKLDSPRAARQLSDIYEAIGRGAPLP
ncbi:glycosyltransferase family 4 protein [Sphingomicrobium arenosum]|uniref:glycosyltransferase family 4 protein n=1 Tax=Sphingomicrobium arenosum TaxID=2233861 RepID=UPI0022402A75|nr:glycosyltransferase family 4 protein [Sphingomicrobium arenosum]